MISVCVPATSANCCVGFDCLGMAVDWWAHFTFEESDTLIVEGCPGKFKGQNNLVVQAFYTTCDYLHLGYPTFKLTIDTDVPFARGLGSSSTCVVAGILACDAWFKKGMDKMECSTSYFWSGYSLFYGKRRCENESCSMCKLSLFGHCTSL